MNEAGLLALVEVLGRDGRVTQCVRVQHWPLRIGRAIGNDVVIDDPFAAAEHLVISSDAEGRPHLLPLPSINGVQFGRRSLPAGQAYALGTGQAAQLTLGHTTLRLRWPDEVLAAERPLRRAPLAPIVMLCLLLLWALQVLTAWLQQDPGMKLADWLPLLLTVPVAVAAWCGAWSLVSKLFQHRLDFGAHLAIAAVYLLAIELATDLMPQVAAAMSWGWVSRITAGTATAIGTAMVVAHAVQVLPQRRMLIRSLAALGFLVGVAVTMAQNQQRHDRYFSELYTSTLPLPALRLAPALSVDEALQVMPALRERLDASARAAVQSDGPDDE